MLLHVSWNIDSFITTDIAFLIVMVGTGDTVAVVDIVADDHAATPATHVLVLDRAAAKQMSPFVWKSA